MCDEPMGMFGGLALGSLLGAFKSEDTAKPKAKAAPAAAPAREVRVSGRMVACVAVPVLPFALWEVLGWWRCLVVAATVTVFAWAVLMLMYRLHRHVVMEVRPDMHAALAPKIPFAEQAALAGRPVPVVARPALPLAMQRELAPARWWVESVEKVPECVLEDRVLAEGETMPR